jgi:hypothetical protein
VLELLLLWVYSGSVGIDPTLQPSEKDQTMSASYEVKVTDWSHEKIVMTSGTGARLESSLEFAVQVLADRVRDLRASAHGLESDHVVQMVRESANTFEKAQFELSALLDSFYVANGYEVSA